MHAILQATKRRLRLVLLAISLLAVLGDAHAQGRPIRLIVSQAAGGTPDIICRLLADRLSRATGQPVVVENRPGGGNVIGAQAAARAAPDGSSFFFATAAALVTNPHTFKALPYDPLRDFVPVSMVGKAPFFVLVHPGVPAKSLPDLVALEKAQPGKLTFATDGPRNFSGMVAAWLNKLAGTSILQAPYAVMPQGIQDTVAGRTQLVVIAIPSAAPFLKRGELRPLALTATQRAPGYEDIPTAAETFPGFDLVGWFAFVAPAGTPVEAVRRFNREMGRILGDPAVAARLREIGVYTEGALTPEATGEFIRGEYLRWGRIVREIGLQPE